MIKQIEIILPPFKRGFHLITRHIENNINDLPATGMVNLFVKHTSAALTINENADPDVARDMNSTVDILIPENNSRYKHTIEGPDDMPAHIKSSLFSVSLNIPVTNGRMNLGTWQGIFLCEFRDAGGHRKICATVYH